MKKELESVKQAKASFDKILTNKIYADVIRDDEHLSLILNMVKGSNYKKILDIGTGTGYLAFPLAKENPQTKVLGIDIAENVMSQNNERVKECGLDNISFQAFGGVEYPFEDNTFDLIVTRYAFHHFPDVTSAIQDIKRILVPGGKILVSDPMKNERDSNGIIDDFMRVKKDGHIQFYSKPELDKMFNDCGFSKEKQVISSMKFPFAPNEDYVELFNKTNDDVKELYNITNQNGVIWVGHIDVGNTIWRKNKYE